MKKFCAGLLAAALLMAGGAVHAGDRHDHGRDYRSSYNEHRNHQGHWGGPGNSHWGRSHHHGHRYQPRVQHHYHSHYYGRPGYYGPPPVVRHRSGGMNGHVTIHF